MPTSVTKRSPGKPAMIAEDDIPTASVPTMKAMASASAPMLMGRAVAMTNIATSPRIEAVCGDICFPPRQGRQRNLLATTRQRTPRGVRRGMRRGVPGGSARLGA